MQIPTAAKCVFKGEIFDVFQWKQKLYDGTYSTFEAIKKRHSVNILPITEEKEIIYIEEEQPGKKSIGLVSGRADSYNEDPLETAKRELLEETGFFSDNWELLYLENDTPKTDWPIYTYIAKNCKKVSEQNLDAGEKIVIHKSSINNFCDNLLKQDNFKAYALQRNLFNQENQKLLNKLKQKLII